MEDSITKDEVEAKSGLLYKVSDLEILKNLLNEGRITKFQTNNNYKDCDIMSQLIKDLK